MAPSSVRFRPILLTAGTVVGAFVILFDPIFEGLAISLMFGTLASTVLTLVVVPLVYYLMARGRRPLEGDEAEESEEPEEPPGEAPAAAGGGRRYA